MRMFLTLQEKRCITDEAWNSPATSRLFHIRMASASFHAFDIQYSDVEVLLLDDGFMLLKKQTFH